MTLLANQQEDGDGLLQNIVTNFGKGSRKGLTDGLREFIRVDSDRALDVGALRQGTGTSKIRTPKVLEGGSDVTVRESPDELTSRDYGGTEVGQEISIGIALGAETVFLLYVVGALCQVEPLHRRGTRRWEAGPCDRELVRVNIQPR